MSEAKDLIGDFLQTVWNDGNVEACDQFLGPLYDVHHDPGDPWDGRTLTLAEFKERVRVSRAPFPDQQFTIETAVQEGETVAIAWHWKGTFLADLPGFKATGKVVRTSGLTIYHTISSRITGHWQVTDRLSVLQQLR